jgi:hypothetical protein
MESNSIKSKTKSQISRSKSKTNSIKVSPVSDDLSLSQLEMMANKKKIVNDADPIELSVSKFNTESEKKSSRKKYKSENSSSSSSSSFSTVEIDKKQKRRIDKENKNETIRLKKSELLYQFNLLNSQNSVSSIKLSMDNSLDEIKNEYDRVRHVVESEKMVQLIKGGLVVMSHGIELINSKYDPVGVDLNGWSESFKFSLDNHECDDTLAELYEKYKTSSSISPEFKLLFFISYSAITFSISKYITKNPTFIANMFSTFMGQSQQQQQVPRQQQFQQPQQFQQQFQQPQQFPQQFQQPQQFPQQFQQPQQSQQQLPQQFQRPSNRLPDATQLKQPIQLTESSDELPSKIKGPNKDITKILEKMNANQKMSDISSLENVKNIEIPVQKKRGRTKKVVKNT